jgi:hypothetical protein
MTTTSAHAFLTQIERLRGLDRASFDEEVRAVKPLWLAVAEASEAAITGTEGAYTILTCGNDGTEQSPQLPH